MAYFRLCLFNTFFRFKHNVLIRFHFKTTRLILSFTSSRQSLLLLSFTLHAPRYYSLLIYKRAVTILFHLKSRLYNTLFYSKYSLLSLSFTSSRPCHTFFTPSIACHSLPSFTHILYYKAALVITFLHHKQSLLLPSFTPSRACSHSLLQAELAIRYLLQA